MRVCAEVYDACAHGLSLPSCICSGVGGDHVCYAEARVSYGESVVVCAYVYGAGVRCGWMRDVPLAMAVPNRRRRSVVCGLRRQRGRRAASGVPWFVVGCVKIV